MRILCGPLRWRDDESGQAWEPAPGASSIVDLRPLEDQGKPGTTNGELDGNCLHVVVDDNAKIGSEWEILGSGDWSEIKADQRMRDMFPSRPGFTPTGTTLRELVWEALTSGATPDGSDFARPLMPGTDRKLRLVAAGLGYDEPFAWGDRYTSNIRDVIREGFSETFDRQSKAQASDSKLAEMTIDYQMAKLRVADWKEFVPAKLQRSVAGPSPHKTSYSDNFNRADGDLDAGGAWSIVGGANIDIISNQVGPGATGANNRQGTCRFNSALSGADHWSQVTLAGLTNTLGNLGPTTRFSPSANTAYLGLMRKNDQLLGKMVNNVYTQLFQQTASGTAIGTVGRLESNGSGQTLYLDGVSTIAQTDTSIPGQLYCGIYVRCTDATERGDDWLCADISLAATVRNSGIIGGGFSRLIGA